MGSEYDPIFASRSTAVDDLGRARELFAAAASPFISSPWSWFGWAILLPTIALATGPLSARFGPRGAIIGWSATILAGGLLETWIVRGRRQTPRTTLAGWVLRSQANLSFVAGALSAILIWVQRIALVPGVWLLVLGHSFLVLGALAFRPFRWAGWLYQLAALGALWPGQNGWHWFALATGLGNLSIGLAVLGRNRQTRGSPATG